MSVAGLTQVTTRIVGVAPLLMCNGRGANPLDEWQREVEKITRKKAKDKVPEDYQKLEELKFYQHLYTHPVITPDQPDGSVIIPAENIEAMVRKGAAKAFNNGKVVSAGMFCDQSHYQLEYDGPTESVALFNDGRFTFTNLVKQGSGKVLQTRPRFESWSLTFTSCLDESILELDRFKRAVEKSGQVVGFGDWVPRNGRFTVDFL